MVSYQRGLWPRQRSCGLATILFIVAIMGVVSACGSPATRTSSTPSTPVQTIHTVYFFTGQSTGQSSSVDALQSENGSLRWHKQLDKQGSTAVSLLVFGNVLYVGRVNEIDALKVSDGTVLWHSNIDGPGDVKVLKVVNGVVYVASVSDASISDASRSRYVYALRASDGSQLWRYTVSGRCCRGLVVTDTAIYLGELDHVDAIKTSDRTLLWHHQIDGSLLGIAVGDGVVYVGTAQVNYNGPSKGAVDALRASDGTVVWHSQTNIPSVVLTVADGIIYVGALFGTTLDALRASDGSLVWQSQSDGQVLLTTVIDGVVYLTSGCGLCYKDTSGSTVDALRVSDRSHLWRYKIDPGFVQVGAEHAAAQVLVAEGMVYIGTLRGIIALDASSGNKRWFHAADNYVFALAVGP
jgi:outer membrane protein assembly factor BamB